MNNNQTFDIFFNDSENCNNLGFQLTESEAIDYIKRNNGSNRNYFEDYKGGTVSVVNNQSGEEVYSEDVR